MFKQAVFFLLLHTLPIAGVFSSLPHLLRWLGQPEDMTRLLGPYLVALLPAVWIDAFYRRAHTHALLQRPRMDTALVSMPPSDEAFSISAVPLGSCMDPHALRPAPLARSPPHLMLIHTPLTPPPSSPPCCRPFNRILVAQHVTLPQMWISCLVVVQVGGWPG